VRKYTFDWSRSGGSTENAAEKWHKFAICVHANYMLERLVTALSISVVQVLGQWHGTAGLFISLSHYFLISHTADMQVRLNQRY
jgi:hypothetical protein